jgi:aspartyl-tRNA synthetase
MHHPFTAPNADDMRSGDLKAARANAYDCVYNGVEVGGGSLRIYRRDVQAKVFETIGLSDQETQDKFGWLLEVFELGAPPHGGIAFGLDRLVMLLAGAKSIRCVCELIMCASCSRLTADAASRDVIAFPKTAAGLCLLTGAPGEATTQQLAEVHMAVRQGTPS